MILREWRQRRRYSQLALASDSGVSARHLSYLETGRSRPSRDMVRRLAEQLQIPPRDENRLMLAAGYAPTFAEHALDAPELAAPLKAVRELLSAHEPYPALAVDRLWNVIASNRSVDLLTSAVAPRLLEGTPNALRLTLHPDGLAPHIVNHAQWRAAVLDRLLSSARARADEQMLALHDELSGYPCPPADDPPPALTDHEWVYVPLEIRLGGVDLSFLAIDAVLGTAVDLTLSELIIESFFPADAETARHLRDTRPP